MAAKDLRDKFTRLFVFVTVAVSALSGAAKLRPLDGPAYSGIKRRCARPCRRLAAQLIVRKRPFSPGRLPPVILVSGAPRKACLVTGLCARSRRREFRASGGDVKCWSTTGRFPLHPRRITARGSLAWREPRVDVPPDFTFPKRPSGPAILKLNPYILRRQSKTWL